MSRLPTPGSDAGAWGDILNEYLSQAHKADGTLKDGSVGSTQLQTNAVTNSIIAPGAVNSASIAAGAVTSSALAINAVNSAILANGAVTSNSFNISGGTAGQVLTLDSAAPGGFTWSTPASFTQANADWNATSGAAEILNKPTIPAAQVSSDWNATSGVAQILNKPSLSTVATSGSYSDLSNKPTLGTAAATNTTDYATAAQGSKADSAVQPGSLAAVATSGQYSDLSGKPTLSTVASTGSYTDLTNKPTIPTVPVTSVAGRTGDITLAESDITNLTTDLGNKQPLDATLTSLAAHNTNGILTQTAADTFAGRTITGTSGEITVTNGDGVAGNPTLSLSLSAAKVGALPISDADNVFIIDTIDGALRQLAGSAGYLGADQAIFGVQFANASSAPAGTRTYDATGMTATAGVGVAGTSDFNRESLFRWRTCNRVNGAVTAYYGEPGFSTTTADVFVEIPKGYYRVWNDGTYTNYAISKAPFAGSALHPAFKHNSSSQDKVYLAAYKSSYDGSSKHESKSGALPDVSVSRTTSRTRSKARGSYAGLQDVQVRDWLNLCVMVEFATRDSQSAIGRGFCDMPYSPAHTAVFAEATVNRIIIATAQANSYVVGQQISVGTALGNTSVAADRTVTAITVYDASNTAISFDGAAVTVAVGNIVWTSRQVNGGADSLGQGTGRATGTSGKTANRYRGVENPFGNVWEWVDNLNVNNNQGYSDIQGRTALYNDTDVGTNYSAFSAAFPASNNYFVTPLLDTVTGLSCLPATVGGSSSTYFADYYYQNSGLRAALVGGNWNNGSNAGLWYWNLNNSASDANVNIGARLLVEYRYYSTYAKSLPSLTDYRRLLAIFLSSMKLRLHLLQKKCPSIRR